MPTLSSANEPDGPPDDEGALGLVPRYFVDDADALDGDGERITVRGPKARRLTRVMRMRRGDRIEVVHPPTGRVYTVAIERLTRELVSGVAVESRALSPPSMPRTTICAAMLRPQRFSFMVEKATELGAAAIQPVWSERSLIRGEGSQRLARWRRLVTEAAEQCRRDVRPDVFAPVEFAEIAGAPALPRTVRLLASAIEPERRIGRVLSEAAAREEIDDVQLLVGPEGGYTPQEARLARSHGWLPVTLGSRPLRAETAAMVGVLTMKKEYANIDSPGDGPRYDLRFWTVVSMTPHVIVYLYFGIKSL